jgi:hypothetical protein
MALMEFLPAPPVGAAPPSAWGDRAQLTTILSGAGLELDSVDDDTVTLTFRDVDDATEFLLRTAGNLAAIKPQLQHEGRWEQLVARLRAHVENSGVWRDDGLEIVAPYLVAKATKPES